MRSLGGDKVRRVEPPRWDSCPHKRETQRAPLALLPCEDTAENQEEGPHSGDTESAHALISDSSLQTVRSKYLWFISPVTFCSSGLSRWRQDSRIFSTQGVRILAPWALSQFSPRGPRAAAPGSVGAMSMKGVGWFGQGDRGRTDCGCFQITAPL